MSDCKKIMKYKEQGMSTYPFLFSSTCNTHMKGGGQLQLQKLPEPQLTSFYQGFLCFFCEYWLWLMRSNKFKEAQTAPMLYQI